MRSLGVAGPVESNTTGIYMKKSKTAINQNLNKKYNNVIMRNNFKNNKVRNKSYIHSRKKQTVSADKELITLVGLRKSGLFYRMVVRFYSGDLFSPSELNCFVRKS